MKNTTLKIINILKSYTIFYHHIYIDLHLHRNIIRLLKRSSFRKLLFPFFRHTKKQYVFETNIPQIGNAPQ